MISVKQIGMDESMMGLGMGGRSLGVSYSVQVWTDSAERVTIGGVEYAASALRDYLTDKVINTIINKRNYLREEYNIEDAKIGSIISAPYSPDIDLYSKSIGLSLSFDELSIEEEGLLWDENIFDMTIMG